MRCHLFNRYWLHSHLPGWGQENRWSNIEFLCDISQGIVGHSFETNTFYILFRFRSITPQISRRATTTRLPPAMVNFICLSRLLRLLWDAWCTLVGALHFVLQLATNKIATQIPCSLSKTQNQQINPKTIRLRKETVV